MRKAFLSRNLIALLLAGCTLLSACGGGAKAATMHLRKTEGKVGVSDGGGKDVEPKENLGLYSGYEVDTRSESYAWVDLDSVKLTKLDENSEIEIQKDGKKLEIEVKSGSLFFNVTEPLEDGETMEIRASTMLVGIRGTCGWVALSEDEESLSVYLLEGKVRCEADGERETVRAGEMAVMTEDGEITVEEFTAADIPAFVLEEVEDDGDLMEEILEDSGIDVLNPVDPQDDINRRAALLEVLNGSGGASYAGLFDMDGDGREDLLLLNKVGGYSGFRWTACLWDGSEVQTVDLLYHFEGPIQSVGIYTTDDIYTVTAGIYRERASGTLYACYYGETVGGSHSNYFVGLTDSIVVDEPHFSGSSDAELAQYQQDVREYEADFANRFETLAELNVGSITGAEDYTDTIDQVRQQLMSDTQ